MHAVGVADQAQGVGHRLGLLEDFFLHVVAIGAELDRVGGELRHHHRAMRGRAVGLQHGDIGRVITAVLELAQSVDENGHDIGPGRDGGDDSTHGWILL
jgi:hypothetical protein